MQLSINLAIVTKNSSWMSLSSSQIPEQIVLLKARCLFFQVKAF